MNKRTVFYILFSFLLSGALVFMGFVPAEAETPQDVYRVYLGGKSIGLIYSADKLNEYIDQDQNSIKEQYGVDKVYAPTDLDIQKEVTFGEKISTVEEIYKTIKDQSPFAISGYAISISGSEDANEDGTTTVIPDQVIYVLDQNVFVDAVQRTIRAFVDTNQYDAFLNDNQAPIVDTGTILEDVYVSNDIKAVETTIPVTETIYTKAEDLAKYLIYGTMEEQDQYVVQLGDTIADVSFNNRISTEEFLIANTNFKTANDLLFPGQVVTLGILQPQVKVIEESHVVERQTVNYETEYINDDTQYVGYESVRQEGSNGVNLVTQKIRKQNGQILSVVVTNTIEEVTSVKRIVVRGTKLKQSYSSSTIDDNVVVPVELGSWGWPTRQGYTLSSRYGYRWGKLHAAIDISGTGEGSPIYAANNGIVVFAGWRSGGSGYTVWIKHANGYYSEYAHMQRVTVSAGTIVYTGDVVGAMGHTGNAQGTHLHFGMWYGYPFRSSSFNPCNVLGC